jgi:hypothetical protein
MSSADLDWLDIIHEDYAKTEATSLSDMRKRAERDRKAMGLGITAGAPEIYDDPAEAPASGRVIVPASSDGSLFVGKEIRGIFLESARKAKHKCRDCRYGWSGYYNPGMLPANKQGSGVPCPKCGSSDTGCTPAPSGAGTPAPSSSPGGNPGVSAAGGGSAGAMGSATSGGGGGAAAGA